MMYELERENNAVLKKKLFDFRMHFFVLYLSIFLFIPAIMSLDDKKK